jgi:hypothetical protein
MAAKFMTTTAVIPTSRPYTSDASPHVSCPAMESVLHLMYWAAELFPNSENAMTFDTACPDLTELDKRT